MQMLVLAVQNVVPLGDLGVATSSVNFFRSMGGAVGVALFGAVFNHELGARVGASVPIGEGSGFTPDVVDRLAPAVRVAFVDGFAESLTTTFSTPPRWSWPAWP